MRRNKTVWHQRKVTCPEEGCQWQAKTEEVGPIDYIARQNPRVIHGEYVTVTEKNGTTTVLRGPDGAILHDQWKYSHAVIWEMK